MEKDLVNTLDNFINNPEDEVKEIKKNNNKKTVVLNERDGLIIERIDKQYVTSDGRMLLREQY